MKYRLVLLFSFIIFSGCYTLFQHPEVEVYYEDENGVSEISEPYQVFVDENCTTCHQQLRIESHFNPLVPAHTPKTNSNYAWNNYPWWHGEEYLLLFGESENEGNGGNELSGGGSTSGYVESIRRDNTDSPQSGGYLQSPVSGGGQTTKTNNKESDDQITEPQPQIIRSGDQDSGSDSEKKESKRKFRKRR